MPAQDSPASGPLFTSKVRIGAPRASGNAEVSGHAQAAGAAVATLTINPIYNDAAMSAAGLSAAQIASVHTAFAAAAAQFASNYTDPINVNIEVTAVPGTSTLGMSDTSLETFSFATIRGKFLSDSKSLDDATSVGAGGSVPASDPVGGDHGWWVSTAQAKALGLIPDDLFPDGSFTFGAGFSYAFDPNNVGPGQYDFQGVALHEISEIMGRISGLGTTDINVTPAYLAFDLFRYGAPGVRGLTPAGGLQFSINGGATLLKLYNNGGLNGGDPQDWASGTNDPFNAFGNTGVKETLSAVDLQVMDVIGYNRTGGSTCTYSVGPGSGTSVASAGANGSIAVTTTAGCAWTAISDSTSWLNITSGSSGSASGTVQFHAAANPGTQRIGIITIAGQTYTVTQAAINTSCTFSLGPGSGTNVVAAAANGSITVTTTAGCAWTSSSDSIAWLTITSGSSGSGSGTVQFHALANTGPQRMGTITAAGQTYAVTQAPAAASCIYTLGPGTGAIVPAAGAGGSITVATSTGCTWTAVSNSTTWLSITSGSPGSGPGTVQFLAAASSNGAQRIGTITIAGKSYTVTQTVATCAYSISPTGSSFTAVGGSGTITVTTTVACDWTASSNASWLTVTSESSGSGAGSVKFLAGVNIGLPRTGIITIAAKTYTVTQSTNTNSCTNSIGPGTGADVPAAGGTGTINIVSGAGCTWLPTSFASWLTFTTGGLGGAGSGTLVFVAAPNTGGLRSGNILVTNRTYKVTQAAGGSVCSYSLSPDGGTDIPASGGDGSFTVNTSSDCPWTSTSDSSWLVITSGFSGSGPGAVQFSVPVNTGAQRFGNITIAGQAYTVTQASGLPPCTYALGPTSGTSLPATGGSGSITVRTTGGCAWSAASDSNWLGISGGSPGSGPGVVSYSASLNSGTQRQGVITIGGQTYTVAELTADAGTSPDNSLTLSQLVGGGGEWNTTLFVINLSNTAEGFTLRFYDDAGLPKVMPMDTLGMVNTITGTLTPGQMMRYQTGGSPDLQIAWAVLTPATPSTARLSGFAVFRQTVPSGNSTVSSEGVVDLTGVTDSKYVLLYDNLNGPVTVAAFANPDPLNSLTILADIRDEQGVVLNSDSITLPPLGHKAFVLTDRFPVTANRRGSIRFDGSPKGFTGLGLRFSPFGTFTSFRLLTSKEIQ